MTTFVQPLLLWGLALAALPILIHLINQLRHRKVQWAAMEFLLISQKKNRTKVKLREALLLLTRIAIIALIPLMLAQPLLQNQLAALLGQTTTHHVILLDDSFSMSDRGGETTAFQQAAAAIDRIAEQSARQSSPQRFTLLRFSQAGQFSTGIQTDVLKEVVDKDFPLRLRQVLSSLSVSQTAAQPLPTIRAILPILDDSAAERSVIYVVSDFRRRQWEEGEALAEELRSIVDTDTHLQLVQCVDEAHGNLSIASLATVPRTRAAGVPVSMQVTVHNHGSESAKGVRVAIEADRKARTGIVFDTIPAGESETRDFVELFPSGGEHQISASLEEDAVAADNRRHCVVDVPIAVPVLIVDGSPSGLPGQFLSTAMMPGASAKTGLSPRLESPSFLSRGRLDEFHAIYLCDMPVLDDAAIRSLESYVDAGGGLVFFMGPNCQGPFYTNQLYRQGQGLFPAPLTGETQLIGDSAGGADIQAEDHPAFRMFRGQRDDFLRSVNVQRYYGIPQDWQETADPAVTVMARLRNGAPFALEKRFGKGHVAAILSTADQSWNTFSSSPSFVVTILELQSHLDLSMRPAPERFVGAPLVVSLISGSSAARARLIPADGDVSRAESAEPRRDGETTSFQFLSTLESGTVEVQTIGENDVPSGSHHYAINVDPAEGDLSIVDTARLAQVLSGIPYEYNLASKASLSMKDEGGSQASTGLLYLIVALLVGEQVLAYFASYHRKNPQGGNA